MRRAAVILVVGLVAAACARGAAPETGPPVNPHAVGETVEVGGWSPVETLLVESAVQVASPGDQQSNGVSCAHFLCPFMTLVSGSR